MQAPEHPATRPSRPSTRPARATGSQNDGISDEKPEPAAVSEPSIDDAVDTVQETDRDTTDAPETIDSPKPIETAISHEIEPLEKLPSTAEAADSTGSSDLPKATPEDGESKAHVVASLDHHETSTSNASAPVVRAEEESESNIETVLAEDEGVEGVVLEHHEHKPEPILAQEFKDMAEHETPSTKIEPETVKENPVAAASDSVEPVRPVVAEEPEAIEEAKEVKETKETKLPEEPKETKQAEETIDNKTDIEPKLQTDGAGEHKLDAKEPEVDQKEANEPIESKPEISIPKEAVKEVQSTPEEPKETRPPKPSVPSRPANRPKMAKAALFEQAAAEQQAPRPKPKPPVGSKIGALRSSLFADLNSALSQGAPGMARPRKPSHPKEEETEATETKEVQGSEGPSQHESADAQISAMPANPRARARGPRRRLPTEAVSTARIVTAELWSISAPAPKEEEDDGVVSPMTSETPTMAKKEEIIRPLSKQGSAVELANYLLGSREPTQFGQIELPVLGNLVDRPLSPEMSSFGESEPPSRMSRESSLPQLGHTTAGTDASVYAAITAQHEKEHQNKEISVPKPVSSDISSSIIPPTDRESDASPEAANVKSKLEQLMNERSGEHSEDTLVRDEGTAETVKDAEEVKDETVVKDIENQGTLANESEETQSASNSTTGAVPDHSTPNIPSSRPVRAPKPSDADQAREPADSTSGGAHPAPPSSRPQRTPTKEALSTGETEVGSSKGSSSETLSDARPKPDMPPQRPSARPSMGERPNAEHLDSHAKFEDVRERLRAAREKRESSEHGEHIGEANDEQ